MFFSFFQSVIFCCPGLHRQQCFCFVDLILNCFKLSGPAGLSYWQV